MTQLTRDPLRRGAVKYFDVFVADTSLFNMYILHDVPAPKRRPWGSILFYEVFYIPMVTKDFVCLCVLGVFQKVVWLLGCTEHEWRKSSLTEKVMR
jgi:hypothetical protein